MSARSRLRRRLQDRQRGFTLVEVLVAGSLFMALNVVTFSTVMSTAKVTDYARNATDVNEEARLVLNRMSRELREASAVTASLNAGTHSFATPYATHDADVDSSLTFSVDFNGNGVIDANAPDPEVITYRYDRALGRLQLQAGGQTLPVLADNVTAFTLTFTSRLSEYDGAVDGSKNGVVSWEELDADPAGVRGNGNRQLDALELQFVDAVHIEMTLFKGQRKQTYRTQVDLRNRPY